MSSDRSPVAVAELVEQEAVAVGLGRRPRPSGSSSPRRAPSPGRRCRCSRSPRARARRAASRPPERIEVARPRGRSAGCRGSPASACRRRASRRARMPPWMRRVQRLHAPAEHLRRAGQVLDGRHLQPRRPQERRRAARSRRARRRARRGPAAKRDRPVLSQTEMSARLISSRVLHAHRRLRPSTRPVRARPARPAAGAGARPRGCGVELHGVVIIAEPRPPPAGGSGPVSQPASSTRCTVTPVTRRRGRRASRDRRRAGEGGEQRGMHVRSAREPVEERGRQEPHVAGEHRRARRRGRSRKRGASRASSVVAVAGKPARSAPARRRGGVGPAGDDARPTSMLGGRRSAPGGSCPRPRSARRPSAQRSRRSPSITPCRPRSPAVPRRRSSAAAPARVGLGHDDAAKPTPQLKTRRISSSSTPSDGQPAEHRLAAPRRRCRSRAPRPSGNWRGRLPGMPPPVTWAMPRTSTAPSSAATSRRVDRASARAARRPRWSRRARRRSSSPAPAARAGAARARSRWSAGRSTASPRIASPARPRARRRRARAARTTPTQKPARSNSSALHHAGVLGRLAAQQRRSRRAGSPRRRPRRARPTRLRIDPAAA